MPRHPSEPVAPAEYGGGPPDDAALEAAGWAAGLDVWDQVSKAYGNYLGDGPLANAQLWSLRQAIRRQFRDGPFEGDELGPEPAYVNPAGGLTHRHRTDEPGWVEHNHLGGGVPHGHDPETGFQVPNG